ncbi:MAG: hypothetical protein A6F71_03700 [Cycloclasticus sp. symbiont of Poecilosclerida sp. M]|nr:MAG: hypothetical protein A6F71_03700 [Cycloclasticus sp. symbiont of Poecilosclerida sp. M]
MPTVREPLPLLSSGTPVEMLEENNGYVQIQMVDGKKGWVEKHFLTDDKPANSRLLSLQSKHRRLQEELDAALKGQKSASGGSVQKALDDALKNSKTGAAVAVDRQTEMKQLKQSEGELKRSLKAESARLLVLQNKYKLLESKHATALKNQNKITEKATAAALPSAGQAGIEALNASTGDLKLVLLDTKAQQLAQLTEKVRAGNVNIKRLEDENEELNAQDGYPFPMWTLGVLAVIALICFLYAMIMGGKRADAKQRERHGGFRLNVKR